MLSLENTKLRLVLDSKLVASVIQGIWTIIWQESQPHYQHCFSNLEGY